MDNNTWAHSLIDQLIQQRAVHFCIAPGSRSSPLALAAARHAKAQIHVHFDERGLGFYALGLSMAKQSPAVVIVTSGTAVGNLLPSVMEAHHNHIPLILLTADRPPESRDCGAAQATDQIKLFQNFVHWQVDLPCPHESLDENFIRSQAANAVFQSMRMGPVHVNCPFREPLFFEPQPQKEGRCQYFSWPQLSLDEKTTADCRQMLQNARRGIILIGRLPLYTNLSPLMNLAKERAWPVWADLLSQARCQKKPEELMRYFDAAIQSNMTPQPDLILHFGGPFLSKTLDSWMRSSDAPILHIHSFLERIDPCHFRPMRIYADPAQFCQTMAGTGHSNPRWLQQFQKIDEQIARSREKHFSLPHPLTEADMMKSLGEQMPSGWTLFLANSMPIRDAEQFFFPAQPKFILANRGLAGIDGQIATAAGAAAELKSPMLAVIGDQSSLHDLNSVALLQNIQTPFLLLISNNFGGGIFSHLPIAQESAHFEKLFGRRHTLRFENVAKMFDIPYRCQTSNDWKGIFDITKPHILEILTSRKENTCFEKRILEKYAPTKER
jgi:2-succinyl-5-enolpyruvyl-6-hydroxy-3-cyclohexene-1-carboxylate synthase